MTKVLLIGKDGRTHCIARALRDEAGVRLFALADFAHPGLQELAHGFRCGNTNDVAAVLDFAKEVRPDLMIIGPEDPLAAGVVDAIQAQLGTPCVGPTRALARIESSKSFTRGLLGRYDIAGRVEYRAFTSMDGLEAYLRQLGTFVVKPDGLTGGKGVKVFGEQLASVAEAVAYARDCLAKGPVVIEEKLDGEEFSLQSLCDGETVVHTIPVQDHKRALEGDRGPNTGGMGSYSCEDHSLPFLPREQLQAARAINEAVARALRADTGQPYRGVLYGGFMATADGVRVLEYNARFGDPEAMNVLPLIEGSVLEIFAGIASGQLGKVAVRFRPQATVCKYLVPQGYPDQPIRDGAIRKDSIPPSRADLRIHYAAVRAGDGEILMTTSRALAIVGIADSVYEAGEKAEAAIAQVQGPVVHRRDIGTRELLEKRVRHFAGLERTRPVRS